ncbi:unnamed protein product [Brachionus calyciflorus]|uniref:Uncharacterized protein n=1 Tax=Brachionus calyciflorus TaxID=104777 RepID=A0A813PEL0_9BILA|nr:unnamed protein product [Brachionus calyciflorus]
MEDMLELEDYCVFCSKYLVGMHDFNKKMHYNTCKLRKLFDSANNQEPDDDIDNYLMISDTCNYCFKSLKDFKSDYNKRIHLKCCKIKKETFERRDSILHLQQTTDDPNGSTSGQSNDNLNPVTQLFQTLTETCIFCTKPLGNLNSFNRKMHIEHCKIRKSLEGNLKETNKKNKDENLGTQDSQDIGEHCIYCNKSFARLSAFNRRLHSDHCKSKKRKLKALNQVFNESINMSGIQPQENSYGQSLTQVQNSLILMATNSCPNTPIRSTNTINNNGQEVSPSQNGHTQLALETPAELCMFCSRSLSNLSNFNKNIHIEQCKVKQLKKATANQMKQANKPGRKRAKTSNQGDKDDLKNQTNEFCTTQILTQLDLTGTNDLVSSTNPNNNTTISNSTANNSNQQLTSSQQITHQFDTSNTTILSLNQLDNTTIHQLTLAASRGANQNLLNTTTHTLQITLDPNTNRIYI